MKKKLLALALACSMVFAMTACGKDEEKTTEFNFDVDVDVPDVDVADLTTEDATEGATEVTASDNEITISGMISLSLKGTDYEEYEASSTATTRVYAENNQLQTIAISALSTVGQTNLEEQFKAQIESVYGTNYTLSETTFNGITYTTYNFGTNNIVSSEINVTAYVYVDANVAIYCEEAWATMIGSPSGDTETVLNTVTIL